MSKFPNQNDKTFKARASRCVACYPKTGYIEASIAQNHVTFY